MESFLTKEELIGLTGARQRAKQIKNLRDNQISFTIAVDGRPRVLWRNLSDPSMEIREKKAKQPKLEWMDG